MRPAKRLQTRVIFFLVYGLAALTQYASGQTIISERTMQDVSDAEAAQQEELKTITKRDEGKYLDATGTVFGYHVFLPEGAVSTAKYPLYLYFGGAPHPLSMPSSQAKYPCYVVNCGLPGTLLTPPPNQQWKPLCASACKVIVDKVAAKYGNIDLARVYIGGFSKCGSIAWLAACSYPDLFAAVLPSAAGLDASNAPLVVSKKIGVWIFQGEDDKTFGHHPHSENSVEMTAALVEAGGRPMYTQFPHGTHHELWLTDSLKNPAWNTFTATREWLFAQKKAPAAWPVIDSAPTAAGTTGTPFSYTITATNAPAGFAATELPAGLSLNERTGVISGTPTETGLSFVTLKASNDKGAGITMLALIIKAAQDTH